MANVVLVLGLVLGVGQIVVPVVNERLRFSRRLVYRIMSVAPTTIVSHEEPRRSLGVGYLATLEIRNAGRRAIASHDFDGGRPIVFELSASIDAVIGGHWAVAASQAVPPLAFGGQELRVGPCLFPPRASLWITLHIDGEVLRPPALLDNPLIDVEMSIDEPSPWSRSLVDAKWSVVGAQSALVARTNRLALGACRLLWAAWAVAVTYLVTLSRPLV